MKKFALAVSAATLALAGAAYAAQDMPPPPPGAHGMDPMGDKIVTRAEAQDMAGKMFDRMDANHDGKLDKADREAREVEHFRKLDTDGNGSISQSEFLAAHAGGPGKPGGEPPAGAPPMDHGPEGMKHDGMGHGGMGHGGMGHGGMGPGGHDMMAGMILRRADADHDGTVTRAEFVNAMLAHFDQVDANHDGKVTPEERKAAMKAMRGKMEGMRGMRHHDGAMGDGPPPPPPGN